MNRLRKFGDKVALAGAGGESCTFDQLADTIEVCRNGLPGGPGARLRILCFLPDHPATSVVNAGLCEVATMILVNPSLTEIELEEFAALSGADAILAHAITPTIRKIVEKHGLVVLQLDTHARGHFADCSIEVLSSPARQPASAGQAGQIALVLLTSGSTGAPKRVPLGWDGLIRSAENIIATLRLDDRDTVVHMLPMFHIGAVVDLFIAPLWAGGTVRFAHPISSESLVQSVIDGQATWFQAVPTMLKSLLSAFDDATLRQMSRSLRFVRSVSADLAPGVQAALEEKLNGTPVIQIYGMTETSGQIASNPLPPAGRKPGSVGLPSGIDIAVLDRFANIVPDGAEGEVCVKGPTVMQGYEDTPRASHFYGEWLRTGDLGYVDDDGYLFLIGRVKEMINRGGEKISPLEIEKRLYELPDVREAAAFAVPHQSLGEDVGLAVALKDGAVIGEADIRRHLSETLGHFKQPRRVGFYEALPKLGSGKIDKIRLAQVHGAARKSSGTKSRVRSRLGDLAAEVWSRTLNSAPPNDHDDFFETNGDSLSAQTFILELEEKLSLRIPANLLYEAPTFGVLETALLQLQERAQPIEDLDEVFEAVRATTASWPGVRRHDMSLAVGRKNIGTKTPFFFCGGMLTDLADALDDDRPCYIMRTLSGLSVKSDENNRKLAWYYAEEINALQPEGPILLGGLCQGAVVAELVAENLIDQGREIGLFVVVDRLMKGVYPYPAAFIWSDTTNYSALNHFHEPERGLPHMFPNGSHALRAGVRHEECLFGSSADRVGAFLEPLMDAAVRGEDLCGRSGGGTSDPGREELYAARKRIRAPRFGSEGEVIDITVDVTNDSPQTWQPTEQSGLRLLAKWQRLGGKVIDDIIGYGEIAHPVPPGDTCTVRFRITYPRHKSPLLLYVDMADEGICWFADAGKTPVARHLMMPRYWAD